MKFQRVSYLTIVSKHNHPQRRLTSVLCLIKIRPGLYRLTYLQMKIFYSNLISLKHKPTSVVISLTCFWHSFGFDVSSSLDPL